MKKIVNDDKWLLVSCLQKSIRKGHEELAISYAEKLYEADKNYLTYRLSIIAVEDVGLGNIDSVHDLMTTQIKKASIEEKGGREYLLQKVSEFAKSPKDRSACELPPLVAISQDLSDFTPKELELCFLDSNQNLPTRLAAGWEILGAKKLKNDYIHNKEDNIEKFMELNKKLISNQKILDIIKDGYLIHREPHFIALGLLYSMYEKEKDLTIGKFKTGTTVDKVYEQNFVANKWLVDGIDWHTKEGKSAIYSFAKEKNGINTLLKKQGVTFEDIPRVLGMLLFRNVGHQVDKRLVYPTAVSVLKSIEKVSLQSAFNQEAVNVDEVYKEFRSCLPQLKQKMDYVFKVPDPKFFPF